MKKKYNRIINSTIINYLMTENTSINHPLSNNLYPTINQNDYLPMCRYCLENTAEINKQLIRPCKCTTPICIPCLNKQIEIRNVNKCEICKSDFVNYPLTHQVVNVEDWMNNPILITNVRENTYQDPINLFDIRDYHCKGFCLCILLLIIILLFLSFIGLV